MGSVGVGPPDKTIKALVLAGLTADQQTAALSNLCAQGFYLVQVEAGIAYMSNYAPGQYEQDAKAKS